MMKRIIAYYVLICDDEGGDEEKRGAIEGVESTYEAERGLMRLRRGRRKQQLGSDVDELEFEEEACSEFLFEKCNKIIQFHKNLLFCICFCPFGLGHILLI